MNNRSSSFEFSPVAEGISQFLETFRRLHNVSADATSLRPAPRSQRHDFDIDVRIGEQLFHVLIEAKKAVYPRDVAQILWQLKAVDRREDPGHHTLPLLIAESISSGAKELLKEAGIAYHDSGGSLFLQAPGAYLYVDKPPPRTLTKSIRTLFSGRRSQVLRTLMVDPKTWFGVIDIAARARVSPATASQVLSELDRLGWAETRGRGPEKERHLSDPTALLDEWARQIASLPAPEQSRYYVPGSKGEALAEYLGQTFDAHGVEYAVSYEVAAQRYAPFLSTLSQVRIRSANRIHTATVMAEVGAREVNEGANLVIIETPLPGEFLFRERVAGLWLASPVQVYLDLLRGEGRSKEMAQHLRQEKMGF